MEKPRVTGRAACCNSPISSAGTSLMPLATNRAGSSTCQETSTSAVNSNASLSLGRARVSLKGWTPMSTSYTAVYRRAAISLRLGRVGGG